MSLEKKTDAIVYTLLGLFLVGGVGWAGWKLWNLNKAAKEAKESLANLDKGKEPIGGTKEKHTNAIGDPCTTQGGWAGTMTQWGCKKGNFR